MVGSERCIGRTMGMSAGCIRLMIAAANIVIAVVIQGQDFRLAGFAYRTQETEFALQGILGTNEACAGNESSCDTVVGGTADVKRL